MQRVIVALTLLACVLTYSSALPAGEVPSDVNNRTDVDDTASLDNVTTPLEDNPTTQVYDLTDDLHDHVSTTQEPPSFTEPVADHGADHQDPDDDSDGHTQAQPGAAVPGDNGAATNTAYHEDDVLANPTGTSLGSNGDLNTTGAGNHTIENPDSIYGVINGTEIGQEDDRKLLSPNLYITSDTLNVCFRKVCHVSDKKGLLVSVQHAHQQQVVKSNNTFYAELLVQRL